MSLSRAVPLALALALAACGKPLVPLPPLGFHDASADVKVVPYPPPPGKVEVIPTPPADMKNPVWVDGEWQWRSRRWVWTPGSWHDSKPGETYAPGTMFHLPDGKLGFVAGAWKTVPSKAK